MRASRALAAMSIALAAGPPSAPSAALLASRDAPLRRVLLCANSTVHGGTYLGHCGDTVAAFLREAGATRVLFVPWALKDWDKYFANPASIEYDAHGQPKDHTGRPQARAAATSARPPSSLCVFELNHTCLSHHRAA